MCANFIFMTSLEIIKNDNPNKDDDDDSKKKEEN